MTRANEIEDRLKEAERMLAIHLQRANKPGASLDDEIGLQKARTFVALAEWDKARSEAQLLRSALRRLRQGKEPVIDTRPVTARERAEAVFNLPRKESGNG